MSKTYVFEGKTYVVPDDATLDEVQAMIDGGKAAAPAGAPVTDSVFSPQPSWGVKLRDALLPSPRTAARVGGGMVGGAAGIPAGPAGIAAGGAFGAGGGEALYQLIQQLRGAPDAPKTSGEAAMGVAEGMTQGLTQEAGGPAINKISQDWLRRSSGKQVAQILTPATDRARAEVSEISEDIARQFPVAMSVKAVKDKLSAKVTGLRTSLENAYTSVMGQNAQLSSAPIKAQLQAKRDALYLQGSLTTGREASDKAYETLIDWFNNHPKFTVGELRKNKQLWDELVRYGRSTTASEPAKEAVYKEGADLIRETLHSQYPQLRVADKNFSTWKTAYDQVDARVRAMVGKTSKVNVREMMRDVALAAGGGGVIGGPVGAEIGGGAVAAAEVAQRLMQTTGYKTLSVAAKQKFSQALQRKDIAAMLNALAGEAATLPSRLMSGQ